MWGNQDGYDMMSPVPMRAKTPAPEQPVPGQPVPGQPASGQPASGQPLPGPFASESPWGGSIPLVPPRGLRGARTIAVLLALGGIFFGLVAWGAFSFLEMIFSIWGSETTSMPEIFGGVVAAVGIGIGIYVWVRGERETSRIVVDANSVTVALPEWKRPLVVPRAAVRLVAIDDRPVQLFTKNARFPIDGTMPAAAFADALDRVHMNPWDPKPSPVPQDPRIAPPAAVPPSVPAVPPPFASPFAALFAATPGMSPITGEPFAGAPFAGAPSEHDAGWATIGSRPAPAPPGRSGHLYSGDGSALPLFVYNELDIPNVAIVFQGELTLPRYAAGFFLVNRRSIRSSRARRARGLMVRARNGVQAKGVFDSMGVVRNPTPDDVLGAGLRPPKPLVGWRAVAFAATLLVPLILRAISRHW